MTKWWEGFSFCTFLYSKAFLIEYLVKNYHRHKTKRARNFLALRQTFKFCLILIRWFYWWRQISKCCYPGEFQRRCQPKFQQGYYWPTKCHIFPVRLKLDPRLKLPGCTGAVNVSLPNADDDSDCKVEVMLSFEAGQFMWAELFPR